MPGVVWIAEEVAQVVAAHAVGADGVDRVQQDRESQRLAALVYRPGPFVVEILAHHVSREVNAAHARQVSGAVEFLQREIGRLHRQRQQAVKPLWIFKMRGSKAVVVDLREFQAERRRRPVDHRGRQRQRVNVHACLVHVLETDFETHISLLKNRRIAREIERDLAARVAAHLGAIRRAFFFEQGDEIRRMPVRVRVDHPHAVAADAALRGRARAACEHRNSGCCGQPAQKSASSDTHEILRYYWCGIKTMRVADRHRASRPAA